jgi:hypothetical protein
MGLGAFPVVSLKEARDKAAALIRQGINPIEARNATNRRRQAPVLRDGTSQFLTTVLLGSPRAVSICATVPVIGLTATVPFSFVAFATT